MSLRYRSRSPPRKRSMKRRISHRRAPMRPHRSPAKHHSHKHHSHKRQSARRGGSRTGVRFAADTTCKNINRDTNNWREKCGQRTDCSTSGGFCSKNSDTSTNNSRLRGEVRYSMAKQAEQVAMQKKKQTAALKTAMEKWAKGEKKPASAVTDAMDKAVNLALSQEGEITDLQLEEVRKVYAQAHGVKLTLAQALAEISESVKSVSDAYVEKNKPSQQYQQYRGSPIGETA
jgi:hypothetical protein